jgi:hypothetical protein
MSKKKTEQPPAEKRTSVTRAALETTITSAVRETDPQCGAFVGVIVERVVPKSLESINWALKGVKYGKADRDRCDAALSQFLAKKQSEFDVSD